jgi:hypothetical protein
MRTVTATLDDESWAIWKNMDENRSKWLRRMLKLHALVEKGREMEQLLANSDDLPPNREDENTQ